MDKSPLTPPNRRSSIYTFDLLRDMTVDKTSQPIDDYNKRKSIAKDVLTKMTGTNMNKCNSLLRLIKDSTHVQEDSTSITYSLCTDLSDANTRKRIHEHPFINDVNMNIQFTENQKLSNSDMHYLVRHRYSNVQYVIKKDTCKTAPCIYSEYSMLIRNEIEIFGLIGEHPNIVRYFTSWIQDDMFHEQLEYIPGGSLEDMFNINKNHIAVSNNTTARLTSHITTALLYLESLAISHGNIKCSNILVSIIPDKNVETSRKIVYEHFLQDNSLKLIFKLSDFTRATKHLDYQLNDAEEDFKEDIFDLGIVLCRCLGQILSVDKIECLKMGKRIKWEDKINIWWRTFIGTMLSCDIELRPTLSDIMSTRRIYHFMLPQSRYYIDVN